VACVCADQVSHATRCLPCPTILARPWCFLVKRSNFLRVWAGDSDTRRGVPRDTVLRLYEPRFGGALFCGRPPVTLSAGRSSAGMVAEIDPPQQGRAQAWRADDRHSPSMNLRSRRHARPPGTVGAHSRTQGREPGLAFSVATAVEHFNNSIAVCALNRQVVAVKSRQAQRERAHG
jgi:hypothetical protein